MHLRTSAPMLALALLTASASPSQAATPCDSGLAAANPLFGGDGNGVVSIEAEACGDHDSGWVLTADANAAGGQVMLQSSGTTCQDFPCSASTAYMEYRVDLPSSGTYELWVRGVAPTGGENSLHVTLNEPDGTFLAGAERVNFYYPDGTLVWSNAVQEANGQAGVAEITAERAGHFLLRALAREQGLALDKIVLVPQGGAHPTGTGPGTTGKDPHPIPPGFQGTGLEPGIHLVENSSSTIELDLWGRTYTWDPAQGPYPTAIYSQGQHLLSNGGGDFLMAEVSGGTLASPTWTALSLEAFRPEQAILQAIGTLAGGDVVVDATTTVEYDGMIRVDLTLSNESSASVDFTRVRYNPLIPDAAGTHYALHLPYDFENLRPLKGELSETAGTFPEPGSANDLHVDSNPAVFVGNRDVGIEFWFESDAHWELGIGTKAMVFKNRSSSPNHSFEAYPVKDATLAIAPGTPWQDHVALLPMPMREPNARHARRHLNYSVVKNDYVDDLPLVGGTRTSQLGIQYTAHVTPGETYEQDITGLPLDSGNAATRSAMDMDSVNYGPYGQLTVAPLAQVFVDNASTWRANDRDTAIQGETTYYACSSETGFFDAVLDFYLGYLDTDPYSDVGIDAFYFDHGSISRMCSNDARLVGAPADPERQVWDFSTVRAFYKELYEAIHQKQTHVEVLVHHNGQPKGLSAFTDSTFVGEGLNVEFGSGGSSSTWTSYTPNYWTLPPDFFEATMFPQVGGATVLLPQVRCDRFGDLEKCPLWQRPFHAFHLVNDYPIWWANLETINGAISPHYESVRIFNALDSAGFHLDEATAHVWRDNDPTTGPVVVTDHGGGDIIVTAYERDGKKLLVLANKSTDEEDKATNPELELLGPLAPSPGSSPTCANLEAALLPGTESCSSSTGGVVQTTGTIGPMDFRLLLVEEP